MAGRDDDRDIRGDVRAEIREFLTTRRARISPEQAGLPVYGGAAGGSRACAARRSRSLAGISSEYYTRLERGNATGVSESVIDGITHALQLDEAERAHLLDLLRTAEHRPARRAAGPPDSASGRTVQRVLDSMTGTPAFVLNGRLDILAANASGSRSTHRSTPTRSAPPNNARFVFLDPHATEFFRDWDKVANDTVALLRAEAGRDPYDRQLSDLIGELSTRSDEFRGRWAAHDVRIHTTGVKLLHHPVVGDLDLPFESFAARRRSRPEPPHLHRRTRVPLTRRPEPAGQLDRDRRQPRAAPIDRRRRASQVGRETRLIGPSWTSHNSPISRRLSAEGSP